MGPCQFCDRWFHRDKRLAADRRFVRVIIKRIKIPATIGLWVNNMRSSPHGSVSVNQRSSANNCIEVFVEESLYATSVFWPGRRRFY